MAGASKLIVKVKNGVLPLPAGLRLAEGTRVGLVPLIALPDDPAFLKTALKLAKPRGWPKDFALNYGHHTKRQPKK